MQVNRGWQPKPGLRSGAIAIVLLMAIGLTGCQTAPPEPQATAPTPRNEAANPQTKKVILTTFTVLADMVQNVAGDQAIVESLTKPGAEIHGYEFTPSDLVRAQSADLILENGLNLERWAEKFYSSLPNVRQVTLSEGITPIAIASDAYAGQPNPHAWMSPQNAVIYVENIRKALVELDPANQATYNANAAKYRQQIQAIDQKLRQELSVLPENQRYIVTCEGAFSYIARDYNLKEVYLWAVNAEQQATPRQVERVIETVKTNQIPAVFCESTVNNEPQQQVAKAAGAKFGGVFYVDSLSPPEGPATTYLKLIEHNVTTLVAGLQGR
ncbi:metal ABC transporter substrate-binding protein [Pantanalinema rosaneae CENA516]|uniref:metal ABC transporter substrate-binding protein n=1 Tax=Pantanalinema rosaneae TaxID=1620701 RepID=UPI003D6E1AF5